MLGLLNHHWGVDGAGGPGIPGLISQYTQVLNSGSVGSLDPWNVSLGFSCGVSYFYIFVSIAYNSFSYKLSNQSP